MTPIWILISLFFVAFVVSFIAETISIFRNIEGFKAAWNETDHRWNNFVYPFIIQTVAIFVAVLILWYVWR